VEKKSVLGKLKKVVKDLIFLLKISSNGKNLSSYEKLKTALLKRYVSQSLKIFEARSPEIIGMS
jgi:hypothetical protein